MLSKLFKKIKEINRKINKDYSYFSFGNFIIK